MSALYHAHSGLRYLVLLAAVAALIALTYALVTARSTRAARALATLFAVLLSLQVLLGIGLVMGGLFSDSIVVHLVIMVLATVTTHAAALVAQRASTDRRELGIRLAGVALAIALITAGIMAIGPRHPPDSAGVRHSASVNPHAVRRATVFGASTRTFTSQELDA